MSSSSEETIEFDPSAILETMERERAPTNPICIEAAQRAADASMSVPDPYTPPRRTPRATPAVIRRDDPTLPFATEQQRRLVDASKPQSSPES